MMGVFFLGQAASMLLTNVDRRALMAFLKAGKQDQRTAGPPDSAGIAT